MSLGGSMSEFSLYREERELMKPAETWADTLKMNVCVVYRD